MTHPPTRSGWKATAKRAWRGVQEVRLPVVRPVAAVFFHGRFVARRFWNLLLKIIYREPLMRYRCASVGRRLSLEGEIPDIYGSGRIELGDDVVIGRRNSWVAGFHGYAGAEIVIGNGTHIGYQNILAAATSIRIGDRVRLASNVCIFDNPSHPVEPSRRHLPFRLDETAPVVIGNNVWIGMNCFVMRGVTIGDNSVIAAGSIVTRSIPPNSLAAGNPARVIKSIAEDLIAAGQAEIAPTPASDAPDA